MIYPDKTHNSGVEPSDYQYKILRYIAWRRDWKMFLNTLSYLCRPGKKYWLKQRKKTIVFKCTSRTICLKKHINYIYRSKLLLWELSMTFIIWVWRRKGELYSTCTRRTLHLSFYLFDNRGICLIFRRWITENRDSIWVAEDCASSLYKE